jgi:hypothetical protein
LLFNLSLMSSTVQHLHRRVNDFLPLRLNCPA